ncbi:MAG: HAD family hydrolase [Terriglobales bacterium]
MIKRETIIFDLDGTAIDSPECQLPTERLIRAINDAEATYNLCAATGRVWSFAKSVLQALRLRDPCIAAAGTVELGS